MKKDANVKVESQKKQLVLRKESIRVLDNADLSLAIGGDIPPDGSSPPMKVPFPGGG